MAAMHQTAKTSVVELRVISSSRGYLSTMTNALKRHARNGDVAAFRAYIESDAFRRAFEGLEPRQRRGALRCWSEAEALCERMAPQRLAKPKRLDAKRASKTQWSTPAMRAKLANAYARAGGDDEKAARILGVTLGSARLAKRRHLDVPATVASQLAA